VSVTGLGGRVREQRAGRGGAPPAGRPAATAAPLRADLAGGAPGRPFLRIGAGAAVAGGLTGLVADLLHGPADATEDGLRQLAHGGLFGVYQVDHLLLVLALVLLLGGLAAISRSIRSEPGASWASFALISAQVGTAAMAVALGIDGFGLVATARIWDGAGAAGQAVAYQANQALWSVFFGVFAVALFLYFGVTAFLYAVAMLVSRAYPRWLGWVAGGAGLLGGFLGVLLALQGGSISFLLYTALFAGTTIPFTVWITAAGLYLWRRTAAPAGRLRLDD
jgi:hypothetical protein